MVPSPFLFGMGREQAADPTYIITLISPVGYRGGEFRREGPGDAKRPAENKKSRYAHFAQAG
jgi:hypothetical protein